ncbi:MAG: hypothetical protein ACE5RN_08270 [Nitrosopumilaceae archaeon]
MVAQKPVNVTLQTILMFIPLVWIYAFYRIEKLSMGLFLLFIAIAVSIVIQLVFPYPYGLILAYVPTFAIPIYAIRKWSQEWNTKIQTENS